MYLPVKKSPQNFGVTSVLSSLRLRRLLPIHILTSSRQSKESVNCHDQIYQNIFEYHQCSSDRKCFLDFWPRGKNEGESRRGPSLEPCGTLHERGVTFEKMLSVDHKGR